MFRSRISATLLIALFAAQFLLIGSGRGYVLLAPELLNCDCPETRAAARAYEAKQHNLILQIQRGDVDFETLSSMRSSELANEQVVELCSRKAPLAQQLFLPDLFLYTGSIEPPHLQIYRPYAPLLPEPTIATRLGYRSVPILPPRA